MAVPAPLVQEVVESEPPVPLPLAPPHVRGLVQIGDGIVAQVDLGTFLGLTEGEVAFLPRTLVVARGEERVAVLCARVHGLVEYAEGEIVEPGVLLGTPLAPYLAGEVHEDERVTAVLDLRALLDAAAVTE